MFKASESVGSAPLMLSVSGARGIVGRSMTPDVAARFAASFGTFLKSRAPGPAPRVCLGRDSRPSGEMLALAVAAGLASVGCRVVRLGVVTTPTVGVMINELGAAGGMVVTASHNPIRWNGLKCLDEHGVAPPAREAERIVAAFRADDADHAEVEAIQPVETREGATGVHVDRVLAAVDPEPIRALGFRVVLDSVNGAGGPGGRALLERLGCEVVHLHGEPTGRFAHAPEPVAEHLSELAARTAAEGAAVGFAQDPDADRLALVDERGRFIGEEYTLALAARRVLATSGGGVVAANLSTSRMIDDLARSVPGSSVRRTPVGEANVVEAMRRTNAVVGGEGNGGVIFPPVGWVRDSFSAMALVLGLLAAEGRPLSAIVDDLPRYEMIKRKAPLDAPGTEGGVPGMLERVSRHFSRERVDASDGVRVDVAEGWVHLRPSNTEPIVRLIAEATTRDAAERLIAEAAAAAGLGLGD